MHGNGGLATVGVPKLLVRSALPDLDEAESLEARHDLARLEDRDRSHRA
jgi:hypothetical protein